MGLNRYYVPNLPKAGSVLLPAEESHHALRVRREMEGGFCVAFDGKGNRANCKIVRTTKRDVTIEIESFCFEPNELPGKILLAVAMPKGDRQKGVIEKAVELGVTRLIPMNTVRCDVKLKDVVKRMDRWRRIAIEATKQTGRAKLMSIDEPSAFEDVLATTTDAVLFSERDGKDFSTITADKKITALYGPKGGWDDVELELAAKHGLKIVTLGGRILRAETASIAITAILQHRFGDLN